MLIGLNSRIRGQIDEVDFGMCNFFFVVKKPKG